MILFPLWPHFATLAAAETLIGVQERFPRSTPDFQSVSGPRNTPHPFHPSSFHILS